MISQMIRFLSLKINLAFVFIFFLFSEGIGLSYEQFSDGSFLSIHVLTVNPKEHVIVPVKADARETVRNLAARHGAVAALNGGFWKPDGSPAGALKINHQWLGTPFKPRGAIGWSLLKDKVLIDRILTNYSLQDCPSESRITVIPISSPPHTTPEEWEEVEHIVGGTPVLICKGCLIEDFSPEQTLESFLFNKHPRTAVGIKENGEWVFVVVDGRFQGIYGGMTMKELAQFMLDLGCKEALNLDGGGSSTMVIQGAVVNEPCGKKEEEGKRTEAVSDAILIF